MEATCSSWGLSQGPQHPDGIEQHDKNRTSTGTPTWRVYEVTGVCTYMYKHGRHGILWQLSACANSVYQALFLLPFSVPGNKARCFLCILYDAQYSKGMYHIQRKINLGACFCNAQLKQVERMHGTAVTKWIRSLSYIAFTLFCRSGLAPAPSRTPTTLWWPLKLAFSSAVHPSCMVEWVRITIAQFKCSHTVQECFVNGKLIVACSSHVCV